MWLIDFNTVQISQKPAISVAKMVGHDCALGRERLANHTGFFWRTDSSVEGTKGYRATSQIVI